MNVASASEIAAVLGHRTLQMVKRYAHLSDGHVGSVIEKMNEKMFPTSDSKSNRAAAKT